MIDSRQHRDTGTRCACRKQYTQRLRIDRLVVGADKNQRLAIERAKIVGIFEAWVIRGIEPVGIGERLGPIQYRSGLLNSTIGSPS